MSLDLPIIYIIYIYITNIINIINTNNIINITILSKNFALGLPTFEGGRSEKLLVSLDLPIIYIINIYIINIINIIIIINIINNINNINIILLAKIALSSCPHLSAVWDISMG